MSAGKCNCNGISCEIGFRKCFLFHYFLVQP